MYFICTISFCFFFLLSTSFIDLYLRQNLTDFDQTWSQVSVDHPIYVTWPDWGQRSRRGHRVQKVIFTKNATPPTDYVAWSRDLCMWLSLTPSTKVTIFNFDQRSFGDTGGKSDFHFSWINFILPHTKKGHALYKLSNDVQWFEALIRIKRLAEYWLTLFWNIPNHAYTTSMPNRDRCICWCNKIPAFPGGGESSKLYRGRHVLINVNELFLLLHRMNNFKVTEGTQLGWGWGG